MTRLTRFGSGLSPFSGSQWIMLLALATIFALMLWSSRANAALLYAYGPPNASSQTMSHCGWLPARDKIYTTSHRNTRIIQEKLENTGFDVGATGIDGRYGPRTRSATYRFQKEHSIKRDGVVGAETTSMLAYANHPIANVRKCRAPARMRN